MKRKSDSSDIKNREALERSIVRGLSCEWEGALWALDPVDRRRMRHPLFRLDDLGGKHGTWSAERREIAINRELVLNHPWDAVREVLLHEMAHQYRDEVLHAINEPPHGPEFQKACRLLRAGPKASGDYPTLDERVLGGASDSADQMMIKIKKLMALAQSRNRHEAESAMAKVHELIAKYNVDLISRRTDSAASGSSPASIFLGRPALRQSIEKYHLAHLLQDFYFVKGVWVSAYVIEKEKMGRVLEISGSPENIQIAAYIFDCMNHFVQAQWSAYSRERKLSQRRRSDFAVGVIAGFRSKLDRSMKVLEDRIGTAALIQLEDPQLRQYMQYRYPNLVGFRRCGPSIDRSVRRDGERIGKKLVISRGITERKLGGRRLLPCT